MNKKIIGIGVVLLSLFAVGTAFAQQVCTVLDVSGNPTTDTIRISVTGSNNSTGKVSIAVSSDSGKPVNATITITVGSISKDFQVRIEPYQSSPITLNYGKWNNSNNRVTASISGAKCLR